MTLPSNRGAKLIVCLFFCAVLLLGFFTAGDYGAPWDENDETDILRMNLWEYARALHLDESIFERWAAGEHETISALTPISESIEQDHGIAAFYPLGRIMMDGRLTGHTRMVCWHLYCWALFTLGLFALYACCRQLGLSPWAGLAGALFMLLSPRFFAEGHYNNKDIVLMALCLCVLWQGLRLMQRPTFPRALLFALAGAFAANAKIAGLALWALCGLFVIFRQLMQKKWSGKVGWIGLTALLAFAGSYALLTPAMWRAPNEFFAYLATNALAFGRWENYVRFRGTTYLLINDRLPWYYLLYMIFATTPLWALMLIGLGQAAAGATLIKHRRSLATAADSDHKSSLDHSDRLLGLLLCSLLWLFPLLFAVFARTTVYNGWRHFYFLYGFMVIIAAYGASALFRRMKLMPRRLFCGLLSLCMALTCLGVISQHPYQYAYYQPLIQLKADNDDLELDYWNLSVMDALTALAEQREGTLVIGYADLWAEAGLKRTLPAARPEITARYRLTDNAASADYVLSNPTYALFSGFEPSAELAEAVTITAYGHPIMRIYENNAVREANP